MAIEFVLKLDSYEDFDDDLFKILQDGKMHEVKMVTNKKIIKYDDRDSRFIKSIDNLKICYERKGGGIIGFVGNLQCNFRHPFGGLFFVKKSFEEETDFKTLKGAPCEVEFVIPGYRPMSIDSMRDALSQLTDSKEL